MRVRNISAGGVMGEVSDCPSVGEPVDVELSSQRIPSKVLWIRDGLVGIKFDQTVDLGELLAGRKPRHGFRPRPPRLSVECSASVRVGSVYYTVERTRHFSGRDEGRADRPILRRAEGHVVVESLKPIKGEVRWYSDRRAGIVFEKPLDFEELAEWVGKRLELASLKASYKD
jgi:hypothetical protein